MNQRLFLHSLIGADRMVFCQYQKPLNDLTILAQVFLSREALGVPLVQAIQRYHSTGLSVVSYQMIFEEQNILRFFFCSATNAHKNSSSGTGAEKVCSTKKDQFHFQCTNR